MMFTCYLTYTNDDIPGAEVPLPWYMAAVEESMRDRVRGALAMCATEEEAHRMEADVFHSAKHTIDYARRFTTLYCTLRETSNQLYAQSSKHVESP